MICGSEEIKKTIDKILTGKKQMQLYESEENYKSIHSHTGSECDEDEMPKPTKPTKPTMKTDKKPQPKEKKQLFSYQNIVFKLTLTY